MPRSGVPTLHYSNTPDLKVISSFSIKKIPTSTTAINSITKVTQKSLANNSQNENVPNSSNSVEAATVSNPTNSNQDDEQDVQETSPYIRFYPTPSIHPMPVTTDAPTPSPMFAPGNVDPSDPPSTGCPPCNGGSKYACPDIACPL